MSACYTPRRLLIRAQHYRSSQSCIDAEVLLGLSRISLSSRRPFSCSTLNRATLDTSQNSQRPSNTPAPKPAELTKSPAQQAAEKARRAKASHDKQMEEARKIAERQGTLAANSLFAGEDVDEKRLEASAGPREVGSKDASAYSQRSEKNMTRALIPNLSARLRWQRKMVIREVKRGGRLTKEMKLARTERSHLARSHFFKTSMKKLAPLARQIAGKSIEEAILQMRFSVKKAAKDVRKHLMQARDEAIVVRGMGLRARPTKTDQIPPAIVTADPATSPSPQVGPPNRTSAQESELTLSHLSADPAIAPRPPPAARKSTSQARKPHETDIYIAQAWVNRGPYGRELEFRARGRTNVLRPPHTGMSVLLKEEKTRAREKAHQEAKAIRRRLGKNMWTQLPDRPVTKQSQYVLW